MNADHGLLLHVSDFHKTYSSNNSHNEQYEPGALHKSITKYWHRPVIIIIKFKNLTIKYRPSSSGLGQSNSIVSSLVSGVLLHSVEVGDGESVPRVIGLPVRADSEARNVAGSAGGTGREPNYVPTRRSRILKNILIFRHFYSSISKLLNN